MGSTPMVVRGSILLAVLSLASVACAPPTATDVELSAADSSLPVVAVTSEQDFPDMQVRLAPPPPGIRPAVSAAAARARCSAGPEPCITDLTIPYQMSLVAFTADGFGTAAATGGVKPIYKDVLAWAFIWHHIPGTAPVDLVWRKGSTITSPPTRYCTVMYVLDATTGQPLPSFRTCPPPSPGG